MDHPFAKFVRILGKGPGISRDLDGSEAREALTMILRGEVDPLQLGAFLCLMRYKKETPEELAGFVQAVRDCLEGVPRIKVDLDWPSYADRHQQLPWFVLSAKLLAQNGIRVFMHGIAGYSEGYMPTRPVLQALDMPVVTDWQDVEGALADGGFAYLGLEHISPALEGLFQLRPLLGLRSPVNSLARELNPLEAPAQLQGVFHPTYCEPHREAGRLAGQPNLAVLKGGGGEVQCNPYKPIKLYCLREGGPRNETWPASQSGTAFKWREEPLEIDRITGLWSGQIEGEQLPHAVATIIDTVAIALFTIGRAEDAEQARKLAREMWEERLG